MTPIANASVDTSTPDYRQIITTGNGHVLAADEPVSAGGTNAGPAPYELFLAGLGACTAITLRMYAQRKGWDIGKLKVDLQLLKNREGEARVDRVLTTDVTLNEEQWEKLLAIAEKTPVTLTIKQGAPITTKRSGLD